MKRRFFNIFLHIFIVGFAIALSLIVCEILTRIFHLSKTHDSYPHMLNHNLTTGYSPEKNSCGWRDREFTKIKNINRYRIACIGDSVTEGYRVALENTYSKVLEDNLLRLGYDIEVMNIGKAGNATPKNLSRVETAMEYDTDLIIYQFGLNDIRGLEHVVGQGPVADPSPAIDRRLVKKWKFALKPLLRKSAFYLALAERYNYIRLKLGFRTWAFDEWKVTDAMWGRDFDRIKKMLGNLNARTEICMVYIPYDYEVYSTREETFNSSKKIGGFCRDNGIPFLDFTKVFKDERDKYGIFLDDCHLSNEGHRIVADHLKDFVIKRKYPVNAL